MKHATVINIQKYSVHDGPGIRTTVFFKGCPLKCWWCHNPESQNPGHEIMFFEERCTNCGVCIKRCPQKAVEVQEKYPKTDESKCTLCGKCTDFCPNSAKEYVGKDITAQELMKEIIKDEVFYDESGGGVTFSGGEPLVHIDFLNEILKLCRERGIHTTLDTSGFVKWEKLEEIADKIDLFLYDIKLMNNERHLKYTGVENVNILRNLKKLSDKGCNIYIRMPIISGINDDDENINEAIKFVSSLNILQVNLLPYHKMGMDKYRRLKMQYNLTGMEKPSNERMEEIKGKFKNSGIKIEIGG
ncbi:glycyl-radical enzyme activating protein [Clostridiaceae bacterium UIB06]|uniref:Glycyl-radical enzyme activating protein n=1 Tax=Clostridium thailandense TaxID=2794346 RepID=A0A949TZV4_9CLOT|nr:trans-4-hydroxy-L-proline dehydratase activase [Clostridium thailandense]MBV7273644.1 glycyl-radical enzyme activating protein [Clostridium thailandense]MCH5137036.1 glycyl-radical enzyme activating protein [Clostridiaceae bacterium UIB06]